MADAPDLPMFDPKSKCAKCGWEIPDPVVPEPKMGKGPDGKPMQLPAAPPPPPIPPTVAYCNGMDCPWDAEVPADQREPVDEHMHQFCDTCGYEWLAQPVS